MNREPAQVIIVGAGLGGLVLALALRQSGIRCVVYERSPAGDAQGSGLTLWPNALRALDVIGIGNCVRALSTPLDGLAMCLRSGAELFRINLATMTARFGESGLAVGRSDLMALLVSRFNPANIRFGTSCIGFETSASGVTAFFDDQSQVSASLLVGADGLRSTVRCRLFGMKQLRYAGYTVWRGIGKLELRERCGVTYMGRGAQFGLFPMSEGRVYWFGSRNDAEGCGRQQQCNKAQVMAQFQDWHSPIPQAIEATREDSILRNDIYDMDSLPQWTAGNVTLLGDAAHPSPPDLGQGACQAIEDAVILANSLNSPRDFKDSLKTYEKRRFKRTRRVVQISRLLGRLGTWDDTVSCWFRNQMIRYVPSSMRLRQLDWMFRFES